jgi:hypothetical protein
MDVAANPLCRFLVLAVGLLAVIGCQSDDSGSRARSQMPQDPLAPVAPPVMPPVPPITPTVPYTPGVPSAPIVPTVPPTASAPPYTPAPTAPSVSGAPMALVTPTAPIAPATGPVPGGGGLAVPVAPVVGSPVQPSTKGPLVLNTGAFTVVNPAPTGPLAAELLKKSQPQVKVVAIVGANNVITDREVIESVWQQYDQLKKLEGHEREAKQKELYESALREVIKRELILDEMYTKLKKANKSSVIDEIKELATQVADKQVRDMKKRLGAKSDEDLKEWLRYQGLTLAVLRRQWERQVMAQQYINSMLKEKGRRVSLVEIREYYDKHPDEFKTSDRVKWQHIFVSFGNPPNPQAAQTRMEAILKRVEAGDDFAALSVQFDEGFAKHQKGFGTGERRSGREDSKEDWIQPEDIEPTVWSLKPGQVSAVVQTPTGYHLVKVVEREYAGTRPFDAKLQNEIREKLNKAILDADEVKLVEELWRKGVVRVIED